MRKKLINSFFTIILLLFGARFAYSQQLNYPLDRSYTLYYEKYLNDFHNKTVSHSSFKPYNSQELYTITYPDSSFGLKRFDPGKKFTDILNVVGYDDMLRFDETGFVKPTFKDSTIYGYVLDRARDEKHYVPRKFYIAVNPLLRMEIGYEILGGKMPGNNKSLSDENDFVSYNMRGVELKANIGQKISIYTAFMENQARFPVFIKSQTRIIKAAPGESKTKGFKTDGFDFANAIGYISYSPNKYFNAQIGHGKHFIGDGYRSLLLSDNSNNYPYVQLTTNFWRIKYVNIFAELQANISSETAFLRGVDRKLANFNYISADFGPWLEVGIFEGIIWRRTTPEGNTAFDYNFLNPLIGVRAFQKNLDAKPIYGFNYKVTLPKYISVYGQFVLDEFKGGRKSSGNKTGIQVGAKYLDMFGAKNLNIQIEYNRVRPYTYSGVDTILNYTHYSQPLAHPLGANFSEILGILDYRYKRFYGEWKISYVKAGADVVDARGGGFTYYNYGSIIFIPESAASVTENVKVGQGFGYSIINNEMRIGYILNPKINLTIEGKIQNKFFSFDDGSKPKSTVISVGIITQLFNHYYENALGPFKIN